MIRKSNGLSHRGLHIHSHELTILLCDQVRTLESLDRSELAINISICGKGKNVRSCCSMCVRQELTGPWVTDTGQFFLPNLVAILLAVPKQSAQNVPTVSLI